MVGLSCFVMVSYRVLSVWPCFCLTQSRLNWFPQKPSESFASCGIASFASGFDSEKSCNQRELDTCEAEGALQMFPGPLKQALECLWRYYKLKGLQHHLSCAFSFTCCKILREEVNVDLAHFSYV